MSDITQHDIIYIKQGLLKDVVIHITKLMCGTEVYYLERYSSLAEYYNRAEIFSEEEYLNEIRNKKIDIIIK